MMHIFHELKFSFFYLIQKSRHAIETRVFLMVLALTMALILRRISSVRVRMGKLVQFVNLVSNSIRR